MGIRLEQKPVESIKKGAAPVTMLLIQPAAGLMEDPLAVGPEPYFNHIVCGLGIQLKDGTVAQGSGQLVVTAQRYIGLIDKGTLTGQPPLDFDKSGSLFCFSLLRHDVYAPQVKKHRLKPSHYMFRSKEDQEVAFRFEVASALVSIANGKMVYWQDTSMARAFSDEGRERLLKK